MYKKVYSKDTVTSGAEPSKPAAAEPVPQAAPILPTAVIAVEVPKATLTVGNEPVFNVSDDSNVILNSKNSSPDVTVPADREVPLPSDAVAELVALPLAVPIKPKYKVVDAAAVALPLAFEVALPVALPSV